METRSGAGTENPRATPRGMKLYERTAAIDDITRAVAWIALDNPIAARHFLTAVQRAYAEIRRFPK